MSTNAANALVCEWRDYYLSVTSESYAYPYLVR